MAKTITDTDRLNFLESEANKKGGLLLHDGSECGRRGLGLRPGAVNRTLRQAIDAAIPGALPGPANAALTDPVPSLESAVKLPLYQAAQWNIAVQCAERKPHGPIVLDGRTVLAVHAKLTAGVAVCLSLDGQPSHCVLWKCHEAKTCARGMTADAPASIEAMARAADCVHVDLNGDRAKALERLASFAAAVRASGMKEGGDAQR